jgi:hypothetical protein
LYPSDIDALPTLDVEMLISSHCIVVDWRALEDEVVDDFAGRLTGGDTLQRDNSEGALTVTYNGARFAIPLTESGADRYITICSLSVILSDQYELRRLKSSVDSDTHVFLLLLANDWAHLGAIDRSWSDELFESVPLGVDGFGFQTTPIPHVGAPSSPRR